MAVDIAELSNAGVSSGAYKAIFTAQKKPPRINKLIETVAARNREGLEGCLRDHRGYWAVDLAYEQPVNQATPALVQALWDKNMTAEEALKALDKYGLKESDAFISFDCEVNGQPATKKIPNPKALWEYIIPITRAYVTVRQAKIFNERDRSPFLPYTPLKQTDKNRVLCDIITDLVDTISAWYGYPNYLKDGILQMLKYGVMLAFPKEEWHCEKQVIGGKRVVQKEGIRYDMPHPTRMFYDLHHPLWTFNSDSGCEYAGHWNVMRAGDVLDNRMYWNREAISFGTNWLQHSTAGNYFQEVFPCRLQFPVMSQRSGRREDRAALYRQSERDMAMFVTTQFYKLIPANWGLGNYKYPAWHRFDMAGDNTVIWCAPCGYNPIWFMGYDFDSQAGEPCSLAKETMPWQYHLGNIMTNMVRTMKQNLLNITWYDKQLVNKQNIDAFEQLGERRYTGPVFLPFDSQEAARMLAGGTDISKAFIPQRMEYRNINDSQQVFSAALTIMERLLQISAQETGATAAHYQSAKEIGLTAQNVSQRLMFTSSGVDDGMDAWKRQIYDGAKAYKDNTVSAQVSSDIPNAKKHLEELGFKVEGEGLRNRKLLVSGTKENLRLEGFSRSNVSPNDNADKEMATVIFQTIGVVAQNQELFAGIGAQRILKLLEQAAKLAGAPKDFDITSDDGTPKDQSAALMKQLEPVLKQLQESTLQLVTEKIAKPAAEQDIKQEQEIQQLQETVKKMEGIFAIAESGQDRLKVQAAETAQEMQISATEHAAEQQRLEEKHQSELRRQREKAELELQISETKAAQDIKNRKVIAEATAKTKKTPTRTPAR